MTEHDRDLQTYYHEEAARRSDRPIEPARVERRGRFITMLQAEGRVSLIDVGAGPGRDASAFEAAGLRTIGIDLTFAPLRLLAAAAAGAAAVQASVSALPLRPGAIDAGWSMSTLVHIPDDGLHEALASFTRVLRPGSPLAIGLWGGVDWEGVTQTPEPGLPLLGRASSAGRMKGVNGFDTIRPPRFFSLRSHDRVRRLLAEHGAIEQFDTWPHGVSDWEYQYAVIRTPV